MQFSDYLRIFNLRKCVNTIKKCKKRNAQIGQKWDDQTKDAYCDMFRVLIDIIN
jgi:hypothetical protein